MPQARYVGLFFHMETMEPQTRQASSKALLGLMRAIMRHADGRARKMQFSLECRNLSDPGR